MKKSYFKRVVSLLTALCLLPCLSAQQRTVSGTVTDTSGKPLTGVTVAVAGTAQGGVTNASGAFSLKGNDNTVLVFSCIGYVEQRVAVGKQTILKVTMAETSQKIDDVVVTALGIKREEKSLGYSVAKIGNEEITNSVTSNWLNGMAGKVAGMTFNQASAGPSGSIRVTLRGESSLDPSKSEALFIVDGVPINSKMVGTGGSSSAYNSTSVDMPIDYGNGASDLNSDDIENITVLKGAAATALYGSRAANGAIIVTTKSGAAGKGVGVTVSSSITFDQAGYWPDFQNEYGSSAQNSLLQEQTYSFYTIKDELGNTIASRSSQHYAFGPRFEGQLFYQYGALQPDGTYTATPWQARDWYKGFFETGVTLVNYVAVDGSNGKGTQGRISFTDTHNTWITPNSGYDRQTVSLNFASKINKYITLSTKVNYNGKNSDNLPMSGYGRSTIPYIILWASPSIDINWWRDYNQWIEEYKDTYPGRNNPFYSNGDSPYLQAYEQLNTMNRNRVYGTADITVDFTKHLSLMLRTGIDMSIDHRTSRKPWGSHGYPQGRYREQTITDDEFNHDFLLKYDNRWGDFALTVMGGGNLMSQSTGRQSTVAMALESPGEYKFDNSTTTLTPTQSMYRKRINSLYAMAQLSYKEWAYVDITGRNDWSSALATGNNSYFYPSVSSSFMLSELLDLGSKVDMLKARVSWATVGNDTDAYAIDNYYSSSAFGGGVTLPTNYASSDIKPEMTRSWEFGLEGRFFRGRIGLDVAYYNAASRNQILRAPIDPSTGFYSTVINAGLITNKGWEATISGVPVKTKDFRWSLSAVYTRNRNKVVELAEGVDTWIISTSNKAQVEARPGGTLGAIYGTGFQHAPEGAFVVNADGTKEDISGAILYDANTGYPLQNLSELQYLGETQNKWSGGIVSTFSYKGVRLTAQIDGQFGGRAYSMTNSILSYTGKLRNTLEGRYDGLIGDGYCYDAITGSYTRNTTVTESISKYYDFYYNRDNVEANIFSTSFVKLREVRLEYSLPRKIVERISFLQGASIAVFGRNLAMWTRWPQYDPEVASLDGSTITTGFESGSFPMTRSWGVNLKLKF